MAANPKNISSIAVTEFAAATDGTNLGFAFKNIDECFRVVDGPLGEWQCLIDTPGPSQSEGLVRGSLSGSFHGSPVTWADKL